MYLDLNFFAVDGEGHGQLQREVYREGGLFQTCYGETFYQNIPFTFQKLILPFFTDQFRYLGFANRMLNLEEKCIE